MKHTLHVHTANKQRLKHFQFRKESNAGQKTERSGINNGGRSTTSGIGEAQTSIVSSHGAVVIDF